MIGGESRAFVSPSCSVVITTALPSSSIALSGKLGVLFFSGFYFQNDTSFTPKNISTES